MLRGYAGLTFGGVELVLEAVHTTADGCKLLVTHGDAFDGVVLYARWLAFLGDKPGLWTSSARMGAAPPTICPPLSGPWPRICP